MVIRPATAAEQDAIKHMVRVAKLNPFNVRWQNFRVADMDGRIVGIGQLRPYSDGSRELASLAVLPEVQKHGIGSQITAALMADQHPPIYLFCEHVLEDYYIRFGFHLVEDAATLPPPLARLYRAGRLIKCIDNLFSKTKMRLISMCWGG
jgi:amino-acid N-acetyltransferase